MNSKISNVKLTVVYDVESETDVKDILSSRPWAAVSHSNAIKERDRALREVAHSAPAAPVDADVQQDAERLDYLQECGVTVEVLPGRPGWTFRIGGLHGTVHRSVRTAIDAARAAQGGK